MARKQFKTIFVTGARETKKFSLNFIKKKLEQEILENWTNEDKATGYVIVGTSRDIDTAVVSACKFLNIKCLQAPANFLQLTGASAEQLRNLDVVQTFKPDPVIVFSHKSIDDSKDTVLEHLEKLTKKKSIILKVFN